MVVMCEIPSIVLTNMLFSVGRLVPARARMVHVVENLVYSKNCVTFDILVNLIIVAVTAVVLMCTAGEKPNVPVRVWLGGYLVQCLIHVVLVWSEYRRRVKRREVDLEAAGDGSVGDDDANVVVLFCLTRESSPAYIYDSLNMVASFVWVKVGLNWVKSGGKLLLQNAPWLYRLTKAYQTYDIAFVMFLVTGIVVFCSLSSIYEDRYPVAGQQENASEADLNVLPKYRFHMSSNGEKPIVGAGVMVPMDTSLGDKATECVLLPEDAECCICLGLYEEGIELHVLPCNHHFHATCIQKWLNINATCPVCKFNIPRGSIEV